MLKHRDISEGFINKFTWKEISDPIYGYAYFNKEVEERIINSLIIQRLRYILQLQTAHLVYPGAVHTRFQHAVGVMHLAGLMAEDIISKIMIYYGKEYLDGYKPDTLIQAVRLAGLLHDAGHAAFGHSFEEAIIWSNKEIPSIVNNHEKIGVKLVEELLHDKIKEFEDHYGLDHLYDVLMAILKPETPKEPILLIMRWLVKDSLYPSDILDFLRRDSYYTGTSEYGYISYERLYRNTYPYFEDGRPLLLLDRNSWGEFRAYLYAKASMYEHVYYHSVCRAFDMLLIKLLSLLDKEIGLTSAVFEVAKGNPYPYLMLTDVKLYDIMLDYAVKGNGGEVSRLARRLLIERKPEWKRVGREYMLTGYKGPQVIKEILKLVFRRDYQEEIRKAIEEQLYDRFKEKGIDREDLWVDVVVISPVPRSILIPGSSSTGANMLTLFIGKKKGRSIVKDRDVLLIEEGIPLQVIFRAYIRRGLHKLEYEKTVSEIIRTTVNEKLGLDEETYRKTITSVLGEIKKEELEKKKITA